MIKFTDTTTSILNFRIPSKEGNYKGNTSTFRKTMFDRSQPYNINKLRLEIISNVSALCTHGHAARVTQCLFVGQPNYKSYTVVDLP